MAFHKFSFEKLEVWQDARILTIAYYKLTETFPVEEKFGLSQQIRRAAISICSNIAEGSSRTSAKDKAHFTTLAFGSLMELLNQSIIACDLKLISENQLSDCRIIISKISIKLSNLKKSQLSKLTP